MTHISALPFRYKFHAPTILSTLDGTSAQFFSELEIGSEPHPKMRTSPSIHSNVPGRDLSFHAPGRSPTDLDLLSLAHIARS